MANTIKIKNSGTASAVPASLEHGELGLNYADGKIFFKNSSNTIVDYGTIVVAGAGSSVVVSDTAPSSPGVGDIWYESDTGKMFVYYDSFWVEASGTGSIGSVGPTGPTGSTGSAGATTTSPTGSVIAFAGSSAPTDWLLCYGQAVSRTTYASLFAIVSTTYGVGDGTTTFNLPDLRGRTVAGVDNMGGSDAGRLDIANSSGVVVGSQYVTLTSAQSGVPAHSHGSTASFSGSFTGSAASHNHTQNAHSHVMNYADNGSIGSTRSVLNAAQTTGSDTGEMASATATNQATSITPAGSISGTVTMTNPNNTTASAAESHSVMQPTMVLNYIIKI
jgi:microcystin-dependent protein